MEREILSIKRKALRINLDESIYGTFAEIGAGQECGTQLIFHKRAALRVQWLRP